MSASMSLLELLKTKTLLNYYTREEMRISERYNGVHKDLEKWTTIETKYDDAYDKVMYDDTTVEGYTHGNERDADAYATLQAKFSKYVIEETKDELQRLDDEFDMQMTTMNAMIEQLKAEEESYKNFTAQKCQDTGLITGK